MSRLKVLLRGALISEIELNPAKEYTGGRKDGSDIRLQAEKGISREHFKLRMNNGQWMLQAVSRFGELFSLGRKVEEISLEHGQSFQIPPYEFQLIDVPDSDSPNQNEHQQAAVNETERTVLGAAPQLPYIKLVNSNGEVTEMLRLEVGDLWVAGRDPACQIVIADQRVSRRQFEIHKVNGIYTILDLASVNGTFLNGSPISSTDPQALKSGDAITVLDNTLYFELHDPNFKFKLEKIDIPVIPFNDPSEEEIGDDFMNQEQIVDTNAGYGNQGQNYFPTEIPNIAQDDIGQQMQMNQGGPFTGVPPQGDPNQFYTFTPPPPIVQKTPWQKFIKNKPLVIAAVLLFLGGAYWLSENMNGEETKPVVAVNEGGDAFSKLTPQQQAQVKELYSLADQMMSQQKFDLALEKIRKIHEMLPAGYKESKAMLTQAEQSLLTIVQQQEDEKRQREEEEQKKLFATIVTKCEKMIGPTVDLDKIKECLSPIAAIDPNNPDYVRLVSAAEKIVTDKLLKQAEAKSYSEQVKALKDLFAVAEETQKAGYAFKAIKRFEDVINSKLPDPKKLKEKSKTRIAFIRQKIDEKTSKNVTEADTLFQESKLKQAIGSLRESLVYDPENTKVKERITLYTLELRRQMMNIYQEAIIDESYGIVDNTDTRLGAKDKWKKIVDLDIEDGDYYKKAVIKLRKYGVM
ncbi:MAG: FHA domain-containing protein [Bdellovibrio sp.]|nr:FHA domain-containing protein [Bdellovibrio sp.]